MQAITLNTTQIPKPAGVTPAGWFISLSGPVNLEYSGAIPQHTFADVPNGLYTITAYRQDLSDNAIGSAVTREFTVVDGEMVDVVVSILVGGV
jgi:hypothetical protein